MIDFTSTSFLLGLLVLLGAVFIGSFFHFWLKARRMKKFILPRMKKSVFLEIQVPKENPDGEHKTQSEDQKKAQISVAEQIFTTLSATSSHSLFGYDDYISFEIAAVDKKISFYVNCSKNLRDLVEKQIQAQYPHAQIEAVRGYNPFSRGSVQSTAELVLQKSQVYSFRTYKNMESDPLNAITNAMSKLEENEGAVVQLIISPAGESWRSQPQNMALEIQQGKNPSFVDQGPFSRFMHEFGNGIKDFAFGSSRHQQYQNDLSGEYKPIQLTPQQQEIVKRLEEKASRSGYCANLRLVTSSPAPGAAEMHMRNLLSSFMQFSMPPFNSLKVRKRNNKDILYDYMFRIFYNRGNSILNTEELASIWHLPTADIETPNIKWLQSKKAPAPVNLPREGLLLGINNFRNIKTEVRIAKDDRRRHMYILGRTGSGKSELMRNMAIQDIKNGEGLCVIDPHGDLIEGILPHVPKERAEDVILFEPFDTERPFGLNILEVHSEEQKDVAVQEMIAIFYKLVTDPQMLGPMFEHNMRNAMLTLMADEEYPGTIIDIPRIFTDTDFQKYKVSKLQDMVVRAFWEKEMAKTTDFHKSEMLGYLISKVGRFVGNSMIRNIVGQSKSSFDFREVMDSGKVLLINLAKGKTGEINAKLLGLIIVSKLQMAALSRADIPEEQRRDFYLYVDEFQNFITDAFSSILSEARKYRLNLVIAHQYLGQLEQAAGAQGAASKDLRDAVFGNAGTEICFRIGVEDSEIMAKEFSPTFNEFDLVNVDRFNAFIKLMINGTASKPFNISTMPPALGGSEEMAQAVRGLSRLKYGRARAEVEREMMQASQANELEKEAEEVMNSGGKVPEIQ